MVLEVVKPGWVDDGEDFPIFSVDIHPNGTKFATGGQGKDCGRIIIWNMDPIRDKAKQNDPKVPKQLCQMENHLACVNCVRWSGSGQYLASAGDDKLVMLWVKSNYGGGAVFGGGGKYNHESYKCAYQLPQHQGDVLDLSWSPGDRWLASASVDNTVIIWDMQTAGAPSSVAVLRGHSSHVKGVTWDPVGKYIASQSADKSLRVWRTGDWKEEAVVTEPFLECGGTTHVLRCNWSPDGQYIVSAHAMNSGGPTAQIIDRDGFKHEKDFVGHRKAVTCVRFNSNIFQRTSKKKNINYSCLAIGSRDRSVSVWLTSLKRPFFVCHDLFESSILDLAWSKDGMTLLASSMDGRIVGFNFSPNDLGTPMSVTEKNQIFKKLYGQTTGVTVSDKPVLIENADLLKLSDEQEESLSEYSDRFIDSSSRTPIKGPVDKQIEVKTSDGRRRITPMYIPPKIDGEELTTRNSMSGDSQFGKLLSSSSSSETKSKIKIERRDGVVKPNVSPGKNSQENGVKKNGVSDNVDAAPVSKPNQIQIKRKVGNSIVPVLSSSPLPTSSTAAAQTPAATGGSTPASKAVIPATKAIPSSKPSTEAKVSSEQDKSKEKDKDKEGDEENVKGKKPPNRIESSSDESSSSDSSDGSSESSSSEDETASQTEKSGRSEGEGKDKTKSVKKDLLSSVVGSKRKGEDISSAQPQKKRGRPLGTFKPRESDSGIATPPVKVAHSTDPVSVSGTVISAPVPAVAVAAPVIQSRLPTSPNRAAPGLPPLSIPSNPFYLQLKTTEAVFNVNIQNDHEKYAGGSVHRVTVHSADADTEAPPLWETVFTAPIAGAAGGGNLLVFICRDATLHLFTSEGARALPPLTLPSPPHRLKADENLVTCITTNGRIFVWNLAKMPPKSILKNIEISPLNRHTSPRTSVSISSISFNADSQPVLTLADGSAHSYSHDLGCWLQLTHSRQALSLSTAMGKGPPSASLPLAALTVNPTGMSKLETATASTWTLAVIETKLTASLYLRSPQEYKFWLLRLVKQLTSRGDEVRLRSVLDGLSSPTAKEGSLGRQGEIIGLKRADLFSAALPLLAGNLALQRLYSEYRNQLELEKSGSVDLFAA